VTAVLEVFRRRQRHWLQLFAAVALAGIAGGCAASNAYGPGGSSLYRVARNETLVDVAQRHNVGYVELVAANPDVDPWLPKPGTTVIIPKVHLPPKTETSGERIVINLAEMRLFYFGPDSKPKRSYAIGIGRDGLTTPVGTTTILRKVKDPSWRPTARMRKEDPKLPAIVPPGPDNPMGSRALYLALRPYAIHGTNRQFAVGRRVSSGCIRLYKKDIEELYELVRPGTKVTIVDQPVKIGWINHELYIEAHPTQKQSDQLTFGKPVHATMTDAIAAEVRAAAGPHSKRLDWALVKKAAVERRGYPVRITR
jgi:L,D-transpeptidase ErfK/SrfK